MAPTRAYDTAEYLDTPEMIAGYLTEALDTDDRVFIARAIETVARAQGMTALADAAGVSRAELYRALGGDAAKSEAIRKVLASLGVEADRIARADVA